MPNALEQLVGEMTLAELASKSKRSLDHIVSFALGSGSTATATPARVANGLSAKKAPRTARGVNTRSASGRAAYEQAVLDVVTDAKTKVSAQEIRSKVGGTPQQARAALNRLVEAGQITYEGKARATRYSSV